MEFLDLAKERYSVRKYKAQQIEQVKLDKILEAGNIAPTAVNYQPQRIYVLQSEEALAKAKALWYPFGGRGHTQEHFGNKTIMAIAESHGKTPAQVILRWQVQAGFIAIPGSSNPEHIAENFDIFDFALTDEEMQAIYDLDRYERYENW